MKFDYTDDQLAREAQLLVSELRLTVDEVLGDGAGIRAMNLEDDHPYTRSLHPDAIDLADLPIWRDILWLEAYVRDARILDGRHPSLTRLSDTISRVFSPAVVSSLEEEKLSSPEWEGVDLRPGAIGAGEVPLGFFYNGIISRLLKLAQVRAKMDNNERVTLAEIALLLDVPEQTVMTNAHRKKFPTVEDAGRRYAEPVDVLPWMKQYGYRPTEAASQHDSLSPSRASPADLLFVPVAADGTWFSPETQQAGRYVIGEKGAEFRYTDYFEALQALNQMKRPRWRRKNSNGHAGIVSGVRFDRVSRVELQKALKKLVPSV